MLSLQKVLLFHSRDNKTLMKELQEGPVLQLNNLIIPLKAVCAPIRRTFLCIC